VWVYYKSQSCDDVVVLVILDGIFPERKIYSEKLHTNFVVYGEIIICQNNIISFIRDNWAYVCDLCFTSVNILHSVGIEV
jgi:hypothetical protein